MSNRANSTRPPSYRLHKASGQAVVTIDRRDHYLGVHGTPDSRLRYERLISAWMAGDRSPVHEESSGDITVAEVCLRYLRWADGYYIKDGKQTSEVQNIKRAIKAIRETYASLPAREFSPLKLKTVRQRFVDGGLTRGNVNRYITILVRCFRWAGENELVSGEVVHSLQTVKALAKGRCGAPDNEPVPPVDEATIDATLPFLSPQIKAMVKIQLLLACRPGELVAMRPCEVDQSGPVWIYRPRLHKTMHRGKDRIVPIGPRARLLLAPWLPEDPERFCFPSQRSPHITVDGYAQAIIVACGLAGIEPWTPNQLRHSGATPDSPAGQLGCGAGHPGSFQRPHD